LISKFFHFLRNHRARRSLSRPLATVLCAAAVVTITLPQSPAGAAPSTATRCRNGFVGLTYDDGPNPTSTIPLLNALKAGHARATFFIWGQHAMQFPDLLQPGGIILMHDGGYQTTIDAVPRVLAGLASRGLCPGKIVYTPADISGDGQIFHAVAVAP
jgi:peptidoglycan/xylan/chitin deacetylase (PgdA/CDA1 family)